MQVLILFSFTFFVAFILLSILRFFAGEKKMNILLRMCNFVGHIALFNCNQTAERIEQVF